MRRRCSQGVPLVFVDTETTGVGPCDEPWEIFMLRREVDGSEAELHVFVEHDEARAEYLPRDFWVDYQTRFRAARAGRLVVSRHEAVRLIDDFVSGSSVTPAASLSRPHLVGACPAFDARMIGDLFADLGIEVPWSHHLIDVEVLVLGAVGGSGGAVSVPWSSSDLSAAVGVVRGVEGRHTARVDALWARDVFDAVVGVAL